MMACAPPIEEVEQNLGHVLIVEDEADVRSLVSRCLADAGYETLGVATAADALEMCRQRRFDVAVVDLRLPDMDGIELVRELAENLDLPVLVLSGLGAPLDRVTGLEAGADDYLSKPFEPRELTARVAAILRARRQPEQPVVVSSARLRVDGWIFDLRRQTVLLPDGDLRSFTTMEFSVLRMLLDRPNEVVSRAEILAGTHSGRAANDRSVDIQIARLRKKLEGRHTMPALIQTVRNQGYMLVADKIEHF